MSENRTFSDMSFQQYLSEEKLMGCRCRRCGTGYLPPKPICTNCFSRNLEWVEMPEIGKLAAFTCITVGPPAMTQEGFGRKNPYCAGVIELAGGIRVDARIQGVDPKKPEEIRVGMSMRTDYIHRNRNGVESTVLGFRPA
jgi:hypothetical protein